MNVVNFEIAKKLKEKGFNYPCIGHYVNNQLYIAHYQNAFHSDNDESVDAPTISQVLKWVRKEKKISIEVGIHYSLKWVCGIYDFSDDGIADFTQYSNNDIDDTIYILYESYEQAALAGIEYVLDNVIKKNDTNC
jgi:hypothetical protein